MILFDKLISYRSWFGQSYGFSYPWYIQQSYFLRFYKFKILHQIGIRCQSAEREHIDKVLDDFYFAVVTQPNFSYYISLQRQIDQHPWTALCLLKKPLEPCLKPGETPFITRLGSHHKLWNVIQIYLGSTIKLYCNIVVECYPVNIAIMIPWQNLE